MFGGYSGMFMVEALDAMNGMGIGWEGLRKGGRMGWC